MRGLRKLMIRLAAMSVLAISLAFSPAQNPGDAHWLRSPGRRVIAADPRALLRFPRPMRDFIVWK
jgi:hypothetical protein